jgi:hypothetical protein
MLYLPYKASLQVTTAKLQALLLLVYSRSCRSAAARLEIKAHSAEACAIDATSKVAKLGNIISVRYRLIRTHSSPVVNVYCSYVSQPTRVSVICRCLYRIVTIRPSANRSDKCNGFHWNTSAIQGGAYRHLRIGSQCEELFWVRGCCRESAVGTSEIIHFENLHPKIAATIHSDQHWMQGGCMAVL